MATSTQTIEAKPDTMGAAALTDLEKRLLDSYQHGFPLTPRPYRDIARELDSDEATVIATLERLKTKGVHMGTLTLHVGAGTFQPVRAQHLEDHVMHSEYLELDERLVEQVGASLAVADHLDEEVGAEPADPIDRRRVGLAVAEGVGELADRRQDPRVIGAESFDGAAEPRRPVHHVVEQASRAFRPLDVIVELLSELVGEIAQRAAPSVGVAAGRLGEGRLETVHQRAQPLAADLGSLWCVGR